MSKPSRSFPRPLSDLLAATLSDVLKAQGFASTEIISRWDDIVGPEIAAHSEPLKINWPRAAATRSRNPPRWCCGSRVPRRSKSSICPQSFLSGSIVSSVGRPSAALPFAKLRSAVANRRQSRKIDDAAAARIADALPDVKDDDLRQALGRLGSAIKGN